VSYRLVLVPGAARALERLRGPIQVALRGAILALADERRPAGSRKLSGVDLYRVPLRIDGVPWRIIYQVRDDERVVLITRVARRDEGTYRRL
jgi:mRNA-degrading endonuclease RelE of RelBE toxin-antitoxin system